ncbi:uncharacterized protein LACBIDRAFT_333069 [Laccaria bicolor S238N-H82]|uniref:Predicted protein n=1 Tax=Laccaria bicolor (strain S238N-H82 / ATCC MYA-4686) TaxID=486041 RepID=B0DUR9_LACBS|nr:uncharacterized protein LACBIDRAFT_333069 [Laccaria bicolor S238N-H82]EDR01659.1 predicted protein [Laccaria bicolor S238N-H82]|eukprot:XP_001887735.1 predicted protein [Laccaria bicolor S238N-H82]
MISTDKITRKKGLGTLNLGGDVVPETARYGGEWISIVKAAAAPSSHPMRVKIAAPSRVFSSLPASFSSLLTSCLPFHPQACSTPSGSYTVILHTRPALTLYPSSPPNDCKRQLLQIAILPITLLFTLIFSVLVLPSVLLQRAIEGGGLRFGLVKGRPTDRKQSQNPSTRTLPLKRDGSGNRTEEEREVKGRCSKGQKENAKRDSGKERLWIKHIGKGRKQTHLAHPGKARTLPPASILPPLSGQWTRLLSSRRLFLQPTASRYAYPLLLMLVDPDGRARAYYHSSCLRGADGDVKRVLSKLPVSRPNPAFKILSALELPCYTIGHHQQPSPIDAPSTPPLFFGPRITNRQDINDVSGCYGRPAYKRVIAPLSPALRGVDVLPYAHLYLPPKRINFRWSCPLLTELSTCASLAHLDCLTLMRPAFAYVQAGCGAQTN